MKIAAGSAAVLLVTGLVFAQVQSSTAHGGMQRHFQFIANYLSLTDAQKQAAQTILQEAHAQAEPILAQLKTGHQDMAAAVKGGKSDAELTAIATAQGNLMGQLAAIHAKAMSKIYAQLTPDQKAKADQLHEHFQGMMQHRFGGMMQQHFGGMMHHNAQ
jgi:Spy/CpxP family protein refolding chaperone